MRKEDFPIDKNLVKEFIDTNLTKWKKKTCNEEYIFVNFSMVRMQVAWIVPKLLYAKGIQEESNCKVIVFTWKPNEELSKFIESFGFLHISLDELCKSSFLSFFRALIKTIRCFLFESSGEQLKKLRACNIIIGKSIYEDILRNSSLSTIKSIRNKTCLKKIIHLLWTFYAMEIYSKKHKPRYVVCDDLAYHEVMFLKLWSKFGAKIYRSNYGDEHPVKLKKNGELESRNDYQRDRYTKFLQEISEKEAISWSEKYLEERYKGKNGRNIDRGAFAGRCLNSREEAAKEIGFDIDKKNAVIMAHTFTDAVFNYGDTYFKDYYDWTEQTLKFVSTIKKVNWILKPHPTRSAYNESVDSIEKMYIKHKADNIYILEDNISAESIRNFADVIITIGGNAGAEFSCEGIPAIIVGKPYYSGFGYTIEPKNKEEYYNILKNVNDIMPLTVEQINTAKKIFYLRNHGIVEKKFYTDKFCTLVNDEYQKMINKIALQYFNSNEGTKTYNNQILKQMISFFKENDMELCEYYQRGRMRGMQKEL